MEKQEVSDSSPPDVGQGQPDIEKNAVNPQEIQEQGSKPGDIQVQKESGVLETVPTVPEPPYSVFPKWNRIAYVYIASVAAFSSPVSSTIFYPAMLTLSNDLHVSLTKISLTITVYMIFQGVAPTIIGGLSDRIGRRPAYLLSFTIFTAVNAGLALQNSYAALLTLRCLQSIGSSGTVALGSAVVSDVATRQQRGSFIGLSALGSSLGPALGPVIGGLLTHFLGWRSIFWFLTIFSGVMLLIYLIFIPETGRNIVGNGSLEPQPWNHPLIYFIRRKKTDEHPPSARSNRKRPGILSSIPVLLDKECFPILIVAGILYAGYYVILTGLPQQLTSTYNYNSIQVGLCYLPLGVGPLLMRPVIGRIMDANFRRHAKLAGVELVANRQPDIDNIPIERARLELSIVLIYICTAAIIPYGWVMNLHHPPLPAVLVLLFILGMCTSAAFQPVTALMVDINSDRPAAASAALNLVRCLLGAGAVAAVNPLLDSIGRGWTSTLVALIWVIGSSFWWFVILWGPRWRKEKRMKAS